MRGFEPIPSRLIADGDLSLQARAVYGVLRNLIWRETHASEDTMTAEVGRLDEIAAVAGCGTTALKGYLAELREGGWLTSGRKRRGHPYTITLYSEPRPVVVPDNATGTDSDSVAGSSTGTDSGSVQGRIPVHSCAGGSLLADEEPDLEGADAPSGVGEIEEFLDEKFGRAPAGTQAGGRRLRAISDLRALGATRLALEHAFRASEPGVRSRDGIRWAVATDIAVATHFPMLTADYRPPDRSTPETPDDVETLARAVAAQRATEAARIRRSRVCVECEIGGGAHAEGCSLAVRRGETPEQAYRRWVTEKASDPGFPLDEIAAVVNGWHDLDDVDRQELRDLAERLRDEKSTEGREAA